MEEKTWSALRAFTINITFMMCSFYALLRYIRMQNIRKIEDECSRIAWLIARLKL